MSKVTQGKTTLKITHNLQELKDNKKILFMENGQILFEGIHGNLLKNNERYKKYVLTL